MMLLSSPLPTPGPYKVAIWYEKRRQRADATHTIWTALGNVRRSEACRTITTKNCPCMSTVTFVAAAFVSARLSKQNMRPSREPDTANHRYLRSHTLRSSTDPYLQSKAIKIQRANTVLWTIGGA